MVKNSFLYIGALGAKGIGAPMGSQVGIPWDPREGPSEPLGPIASVAVDPLALRAYWPLGPGAHAARTV